MSATHEHCEVIYREQIRDDLIYLRCHAPNIAANAIPGQFVHIRAGAGEIPILRRPYSLYDADQDTIDLLIAVVGRGSAAIAAAEVGNSLDIIGPLGNGFPAKPPNVPVSIIAGGVGIAPLHFLWRRWTALDCQSNLILGATTKAAIPLPKDSPLWQTAQIATDDGSYGFAGTVVDQFEKSIGGNNQVFGSKNLVYICGSVPMIHALMPVLTLHRISGMVSIEQIMGCGVGACQGCAVPSADGATTRYKLTCLDGPVFNLDDINLEQLTNLSSKKVLDEL